MQQSANAQGCPGAPHPAVLGKYIAALLLACAPLTSGCDIIIGVGAMRSPGSDAAEEPDAATDAGPAPDHARPDHNRPDQPPLPGPAIQVTPAGCNFGAVPLGEAASCTVNLSSVGDQPLEVSMMSFTPATDPAYSLPAVLETPVLIAVGASESVSVRCAPTVVGTVAGTLTIDSDDVAYPRTEIPLSCRGVDGDQPAITVAPAACDFGEMDVGTTAWCDLAVENRGADDLVIDAIGIEESTAISVFALAGEVPVPLTLPGRSGLTMTIACAPQASATYLAQLNIDSNDPVAPRTEIPLTCVGVEGPVALARVLSVNGIPSSAGSELTVQLTDDVVLTGASSYSPVGERAVALHHWSLVQTPPGSLVELSAPASAETSFIVPAGSEPLAGFDLPGTYVVDLAVTDTAAQVSTNSARVTISVIPDTNLHVQLIWGNDADLDLHLIRGTGEPFSITEDCHFDNCLGVEGLDWGGGAANPHLDVDDIDGMGPENINLESPTSGSYRIAVHYSNPNGATSVAATVRVFMGFGLQYEATRDLECGELWEVADVVWPAQEVHEENTVTVDTEHSTCP